MENIEDDLLETSKLIDGIDREAFGYSRIYGSTNEDLEELFKCFSVKDKAVFSVLASSDQPFCAYYNGAKSVETFDRNRLTKHYYYLRKWLLKYEKRLHPSPNEIKKSNEWIYDLLKLVKYDSLAEEASFRYWYSYVMSTPGFLGINLFRGCTRDNMTGITDNDLLLSIIEDKELVFKQQDICGEIAKVRKYNTIIMSNILEYNNLDKNRLLTCRDNLYDILEDDGEVICTNLLDYYPSSLEQTIFKEKFDCEPLTSETQWWKKSQRAIGYCYHKK